MRTRALLAVSAAGLMALAACGGSSSDDGAASPRGAGGGLSGTLTVFAAASLTDVFTEVGDDLMADNPSLQVRFSFAGTPALATQLLGGAPADVFAAADEVHMTRVQDEGIVDRAEVFAENSLALVVPTDNPAGVTASGTGTPRLSDLITADLTVAVCAPEVPCGAAAAEVLEASGLSDAPDTYEDDVRAVLTKVQLGEVDAGLVYLSDVQAAGDTVLAFPFREASQAVNRYPVGVLSESPNPEAAQAFVELLRSEDGQRILADAGFQLPS